jgi:hypothetical protein
VDKKQSIDDNKNKNNLLDAEIDTLNLRIKAALD